MKSFIVYDNDGNILRTGYCPSDSFSIQARENEHVMEGEADDVLHHIVNGKPEKKPVVSQPVVSKEKLDIQEEQKFKALVSNSIVNILYDFDRRLRVLESNPAISFSKFKLGIKNLSDLLEGK